MKESTPTRKKNCNCKRSRCLKLYCECFASGVYCDGCNCANCFNNVENEAARQEAVEATLERNPTAFKPKIGNSPQTIRDVREDACEIALTGKHNKGCHCKKSGCLKKYCECFQANIPCSDNCKCMDCKNFEGSEERRALFHGDHGNALTYMQQAENAALNRAIGSSIYASPTSKKRKNNDIFFGLSAKDQSIPRLAQCPQVGWTRTLNLAFQSIGVVYGDIGTSPLYVYSSTFDDDIKDKDDILGVLSLILYTLIIIPLIKYVFVVLWANDNGDGGTFALYSLISRHVKISLIPNQQAEDAMLSNYRLETPSRKLKRAQWIKQKLESSKVLQVGLFLITILATSMIIGDGILTPAISVLSAVSGIKEKATSLSQGQIALISIVILVFVFSVQRFGTDKVGYTFAPIIVLWFSLIGGIGIYNLVKYDFRVLRAFNPKYIVDYFRRNGKRAWSSLGGIVLCITGTEAMFADLSHFSVRAIQISFTAVLFPAVSLAYIGQASYLTKFPEQVADTFYKSIPDPLFWPSFIIAIAAAIIASQAMIFGAFSIIQQSQGLSCFPRVKVIHTSTEYEGQVYIPEINYALMVASVLVTGIFRSTTHIGNAYGIAVVSVMLITTALVTLVMLLIWKTSIWWISLFVIVIGGIEAIYLSAVLSKFVKGGFLPLAFALFLMLIMGIWHYVHVKCYNFELENKVSSNYIQELACDRNVTRIPGIGLLYSELVQGIPPIFRHFVEKIPSIHSVFVFVSVKHLPVSKVDPHERFLFRQLEPREFRVFKCVVRYGYKDAIEVAKEFEKTLIKQLKEFIYHEFFIQEVGSSPLQNYPLAESATEATESDQQRAGLATIHADEMLKAQGSASHSSGSILPANNSNRSADSSGRRVGTQVPAIEEEKQFIEKEMEKGVVYLLGETEMVARSNSSIIKRVVVNNIYHFIRRNFRQGDEAMSIPKARLLKVGVTYEI